MMRNFFRASIILLLGLFCFNGIALGQDADFDTTYNIEYRVSGNMEVNVTEEIGVINQNSTAIPSTFIETITNINVFDIKVYDSKGEEINPNIEQEGRNTVIRIPVENPAVGKDKKTSVTLIYKTRDLASKAGRILNVNIPKAPVSNLIQEYNVSVRIPRDFGPQINITPKPQSQQMEEEGYVLTYNKQTLEKYGISATFGDYQIFDFNLSYDLENPSLLQKTMEIAIPMPLKDYQEVNITGINPTPLKLKKDRDGNILAMYHVPGNGTLNVEVRGKAKVYNKKIEASGGSNEYSSSLKSYLSGQRYWETGNEIVKQTSENITDKDNSINANALAIYTFITKNITYDFEQAKGKQNPERKGAALTLREKKGLCSDFTDTFVALARASQIPARVVDGYAYARDPNTNPTPLGGNNNEFLHSWAQYYEPDHGWVSVDPTWGTTSGLDYFSKLDNNHLVFVIRGSDSQYPLSARHVKVTFSDDEFFSHESLYDLQKIPSGDGINLILLVAAALVLMLVLCMSVLLLKARPGFRRK